LVILSREDEYDKISNVKQNNQILIYLVLSSSVGDSDPYPDSYVFGPPGYASRSFIHKYESGSGFFHHTKTVRKTSDLYYLDTFL
jgi:hypothetical protein